jgi:hypothetical protein
MSETAIPTKEAHMHNPAPSTSSAPTASPTVLRPRAILDLSSLTTGELMALQAIVGKQIRLRLVLDTVQRCSNFERFASLVAEGIDARDAARCVRGGFQ